MNKLIKVLIMLLLTGHNSILEGQELKIPLYSGIIPNSKVSGPKEIIEKTDITIFRNVQIPEIAVYLPTKKYSTGQCVVIWDS